MRSSIRRMKGAPSFMASARVAATVAAFFGLPLATACNGCDGELVCDANNHCQICNAYGCHDADPGSTSGIGNGGSGGSASTTSTVSPTTTTGGACDPTTTTCACTVKADCPADLYCIDGLCLEGCNHDFECGAGNVCADGKCTPGCNDMVPCDTGYACVNGACQPDPTNPECTTPTDCNGQPCVDGLCTTGCNVNADCPSGKLCNDATHTCFDDPTPKPLCGGSEMCPGQGQVCGADGYCHYPCSSVQECKLIDNRFVACDESICKTEEEVNPECDLDNPCPNGKSCVSNKCQ